MAEARADDEVPSFGKYKDAVLLGKGGMGAVYRAHDASLDRFVAIKVLTHRDKKYLERFRREAMVVAKLNHPNVLQIYEIVVPENDESAPYLVTEFIDGQPLDRVLKQGPLSAAQVMAIVRQCADGLGKAHAAAIIHRDIKPANILMNNDGLIKLVDFGIAKELEGKNNLTGATVLGTPYYMSPEQAMGQTIDGRSDLYSLGITAFQLLTGRRPFEGKSKADVMVAQIKQALPSLAALAPNAPAGVVAIVERMCAKTPTERFASCAVLVTAIDALGLGATDASAVSGLVDEATTSDLEPLTDIKMRTGPRVAPPLPVSHLEMTFSGEKPLAPPPAALKTAAPRWNGRAALLLGFAMVGVLLGGLSARWIGGGRADLLSSPARIPEDGWVAAGPGQPSVKWLHIPGNYGNCVFSNEAINRGEERSTALRAEFLVGENIRGRCYFATSLNSIAGGDAARGGQVYQVLYIDGVERSRMYYDPSPDGAVDQLPIQVIEQHGKRLATLSVGRHVVWLWIMRRGERGAPLRLAGGHFSIEKR